MLTNDLDFLLPPDLIAQYPPAFRHEARLLHYRRVDRSIVHRSFRDLPSLLRSGDLLVFNNTRVIPARFMVCKRTGGKIEGLFLREIQPGRWSVLLRNLGNYAGPPLIFDRDPTLTATVARIGEAGEYELDISTAQSAAVVLARIGRMPLPPYIKREKGEDPRDEMDRERYQTVFAAEPGSVAAPTAALHFSEEVLAELAAKGVQQTAVTLEVGLGTFKPVSTDTLEAHAMHTERFSIPAQAAQIINAAKAERRRVIAVGTTSTRVLESQPPGPLHAVSGETRIFIYPPYSWRHVDALITNFHLPRSTLIALVAAMTGLDEQRRIYAAAIAERYRFFSYGDSMLIE